MIFRYQSTKRSIYEEVAYEKPEVIMEKIEGLEEKIKANICDLRKILAQK